MGGLEISMSKHLLQIISNDKKMVYDVESIIEEDQFEINEGYITGSVSITVIS